MDTREEREQKIENEYKKSGKKGITIVVLSAVLGFIPFGYRMHQSIQIAPKKTGVIETYHDAQKTLSQLQSRLDPVYTQRLLPYVPKDIDEDLQRVFVPSKQNLEEAIEGVERDITQMEVNYGKDIRNYDQKLNESSKKFSRGIFELFGTYFTGSGIALFNVFRASKKRKRKISVSEGIFYGSLALTLVGAYMTMFKDLYDIGMGLMVAGPVICAGGLIGYLKGIKCSEKQKNLSESL